VSTVTWRIECDFVNVSLTTWLGLSHVLFEAVNPVGDIGGSWLIKFWQETAKVYLIILLTRQTRVGLQRLT